MNAATPRASALELEDQLARVPFNPAWMQAKAQAWWQAQAPNIVAAGGAVADS